MIPTTGQVCDDVEEVPETIGADNGYWKEEDIERFADYPIPPNVAPGKVHHGEWREQTIVPDPLLPLWRHAPSVQGRARIDSIGAHALPPPGEPKP